MNKIRFILAFMVLLPFSKAFAQVGEIIYKDFDPDPYLFLQWSCETMYLDLNFDSIPDMYMSYHLSSSDVSFEIVSCQDNFQICHVSGEGDSISENNSWTTGMGTYPNPDYLYYGGFRFMKNGNYYYGWYRTYGVIENHCWYFDKCAYCTVPNYPLVWGQTEFWDIEENEGEASSKLHPNPATGLVTITGEKASEVQVFNALGQLVKTVQNTNEVSLEGLPQGVYLLRVTSKGGKVFSDKVVKE